MRVCEFDGTETEKSVCPTCNDYKGLTMPDVSFTSNKGNTFTTLGEALNDVFAIMDEAREHHLNTHDSDCDCDYRAGEE